MWHLLVVMMSTEQRFSCQSSGALQGVVRGGALKRKVGAVLPRMHRSGGGLRRRVCHVCHGDPSAEPQQSCFRFFHASRTSHGLLVSPFCGWCAQQQQQQPGTSSGGLPGPDGPQPSGGAPPQPGKGGRGKGPSGKGSATASLNAAGNTGGWDVSGGLVWPPAWAWAC